jgi:hypothetical protein
MSVMTNAELRMYADAIANEKALGNEVFMPALIFELTRRVPNES